MQKPQPQNSVKAFMNQHMLAQYTQALLSQGYDDLIVLKALSNTDMKNVADLVGMKPGHHAKFIWALTKDAQTPAAAEAKTGKAKAGEAKTEAKTGGTKTEDAKASDAKTGDAKAGEAKADCSPKCPGGHDLEVFHTPLFSLPIFTTKSKFICDECDIIISKCAVAHTCHECNYHMCGACHAAECGKNNTYVAMIVDRSGSMRQMGNAVMDGFNTFLTEQQALPGECNATVVRFDNTVEVLQHGVPLSSVPKADVHTFAPRGGTSLLDAMGRTIEMVERQIDSMQQRPGKVMVMILTDGAENTSRTFTRAKVMATIKRLEETGDWQFVFVGANQNAIEVGRSYGMQSKNCLSFDASPAYQEETFKCMSANVAQYRCASKSAYSGFTPAQRSITTPCKS